MLQDIFLSGGTTPSVPKSAFRIQNVELMKQWGIPDTNAFIGKMFHHEIPSSAFSGRVDEYKVNDFRVSFVLGLWIVPCTVPNSCHAHFSKKVYRVPTRPGKPGKMRVHLENLEISWNFK